MERLLRLPESPAVEKIVKGGKESITYLQVALAILTRIEEAVDKHVYGDEIRFVKECLDLGKDQANLPCALDEEEPAPAEGEGQEATTKISTRKSVKLIYSETSKATTQPGRSSVVTKATSGSADKVATLRKDHDLRGNLAAALAGDSTSNSYLLGSGPPWLGPTVPTLPVSITNPAVEVLLKDVDSWAFDLNKLTKATGNRPLTYVSWEVLRRSGSFSEFNIDPAKCSRFVQAVEAGYATERSTAYHTNMHAADVTQTVHSLMSEFQLKNLYDALDTTASLLSAVIHDIGHDGKPSPYHVAMQDDIAITYNDKSVMENFHLATGFRLLFVNPATNILHSLPKAQYTLFRKEMVDMVLSTDMTLHFAKVGVFAETSAKNGTDRDLWHADENAMYTLRSMALHSADISNQAKPQPVAFQWTMRIIQEMFAQGDLEKMAGLPVSPLCDRNNMDVGSSQVGFIDFIVKPSFELLVNVAPLTQFCVDHILWNKKQWQGIDMKSDDVEKHRKYALEQQESSSKEGSVATLTDGPDTDEGRRARAFGPPRSHAPAFLCVSTAIAPPKLIKFSHQS